MTSNPFSPHISIVIPTRDNEKDLMDCLDTVKDLDYPPHELEVIIWDNNSSAESKLFLKKYLNNLKLEHDFRIELIEFLGNLGVYTSRDELFKRISDTSKYILSIDDDVLLPPSLLNELLSIIETDKSAGIIGPRIVYDDDPSLTAHGAGFINWWLGRYSIKDVMTPIECHYVIGCCMFIKRSLSDKIGGFDRDYFTSHGEVDFCSDARRRGYKIIYYPGLRVRHRVDRGGTQTPERIYYVYRNKLLLIRKYAPVPQKWISLFLYSLLWFPVGIFKSMIKNRGIALKEWKMIISGMLDGWFGRVGKRF